MSFAVLQNTGTACAILVLGCLWAGLYVLCSSSGTTCAILDLGSIWAGLYVLCSSSRHWYSLCHIRLRIYASRTVCPLQFFQTLVQPVPYFFLLDLGSAWAGLYVLCISSRHCYNLCHIYFILFLLDLGSIWAGLYLLCCSSRHCYNLCNIYFFKLDLGSIWAGLYLLCCSSRHWCL